MNIDGVGTLGNIEMKGIHVDVVLLPGEFFSVRRKLQTGDIGDGTVGGVVGG